MIRHKRMRRVGELSWGDQRLKLIENCRKGITQRNGSKVSDKGLRMRSAGRIEHSGNKRPFSPEIYGNPQGARLMQQTECSQKPLICGVTGMRWVWHWNLQESTGGRINAAENLPRSHWHVEWQDPGECNQPPLLSGRGTNTIYNQNEWMV